MCGGVLLIALSDSLTIYLAGADGYHTGSLIDLCRLAGFAVLALAALSTIDESPVEPSPLQVPSRARMSLPYLPLLLAGGFGLGQVIPDMALGPFPVMVVVLVLAVLARQFVVLVENQRLLSDVARQAFRDGLTGLANRALFLDRLEQAVDRHRREMVPLAVVCLDLDDFKTVNDVLGHPAGDELLIRVAGRLTRYVGDGQLVARLGGDEFAVLIDGPLEDAVSAADRILDAFNPPIVIDGMALTVRPSIGLTCAAKASQTTVDDLLRQADLAMYAAKREGGGCLRTFVPELDHPYELPRSPVPTAIAEPPRPVTSTAEPVLSTHTARRTPRIVWLAVGAVLIGTVVFAISTQLRTVPRPSALFDGWLYTGLMLSAAGLVAARAWRVAVERWGWLLIAAGLGCSALGDVVYVLWVPSGQSPNAADPLYLAFYPLAYAGMVLLMRTRMQRVPAAIRLDALVVGCTLAAAGAALMIGPIASTTSGSLATVLVGLAYPAGDLLLLALATGMLAIFGWRTEWRWGLVVAGLMSWAVADTVYLFQTANDSYIEGTWIDTFWLVASLLVATASWLPSAAGVSRSTPGLGSLAPSVVCTVVALAVLILANDSRVAVVLAAASLTVVAVRFAVTLRNVSAVAKSHQQAMTDDLTGLANRRALATALTAVSFGDAAPTRTDRARPRQGLLLLALNQFEEINDSLGRHVGDELLRHIAGRLSESLRPEDLLFRTGGDEFAVLLADRMDLTTVRAQAGYLVETLLAPFDLDQITVQVDAGVGIALYPDHCADPQQLLNRAEAAASHAKAVVSRIAVYDAAEETQSGDGPRLVEDLREAPSSCELTCHYQPKISALDGRVHSVEALVRWPHPTRGLLGPDQFLPAAEKAGLMRPVTARVLDLALAQIRSWRDQGIALTVAVNLSTTNLLDVGLVDTIDRLLRTHQLPPDALILELTESTLATDSQRSRNTVTALRRLGIRLSLDDYGTGWSSLARLQDLSVDELKLDKVFVARLARDPRSIAIVRSTVALAHSLGADLVAEGVEDLATLQALRRYGCSITQGYVHCPPVPADRLQQWVTNGRRRVDTDELALQPSADSQQIAMH